MIEQDRSLFEEARVRVDAVRAALAKAKEGGSIWESPNAYQPVREAVSPGIYEHFKSTDEHPRQYAVFGVSFDVESEAFSVVYAPLYGEHCGALLTRSLLDEREGFLVPVDKPGYVGPRFTLIRGAELEELARLIRAICYTAL